MLQYVKRHRLQLGFTGLILLLLHGSKLNSVVIGIDTEDVIHAPKDFYGGVLNTGRQGLVLWKLLTDTLVFHPFFAGLLTLLLLGLTVFFLLQLWERFLPDDHGARSACGYMAGALLWIAHPIMTEQLYFSVQSVEVCAGMLFAVLAVRMISEDGTASNILLKYLIPGVLLLWAFSIYQALVPFYIFVVVSVLFLRGMSGLKEEKEASAAKTLRAMLPYVAVFAVSFAVNWIITTLFFQNSDYLTEQILWGRIPFTYSLSRICRHVGAVLTGLGKTVHFGPAYGCLCVIALALTLWKQYHVGKGHTAEKLVVLFYLAVLFATPFLMTVVCGGAPVIRSQLVLPAVTGCLAFWNIRSLEIKTRGGVIAAILLGAVCFCGIWQETDVTLRFYYTEQMRYQQDAMLGYQLIDRIDALQGEEMLPVVFVGRRPFRGNHATLTGETLGKSFFDHDVDVEPKYYWSSRRILGFLHSLGAEYVLVDERLMELAMYHSMQMHIWPAEDSVCRFEDMIVVKFSEPDADE